LWQAFLQQKQVFLELLDLFWVLLFFGAEMCAYEDVFIRACNCKTFAPFHYFLFDLTILIFKKLANLTKGELLLKGVFIDHNHRILLFSTYDFYILKAFDFLE
jgi:hypothetical protein